jgi:cytochrome c biogenesis protein
MSTTLQRPPSPDAPPALSPAELLRWTWRQLTSMRTALLLLLLLALAAVPGSVVPQSDIAPGDVTRWQEDHPDLAPVYERLGLFSVYDSPWFSAIYLLLMVSLVGCILPRTAVYWRALRTPPPRAPRNLGRLPAYLRVETDGPPEQVLAGARAALRRRRYRVAVPDEADAAVSAERGHLREAGNLLFHVSIIVVLVGFAYGQLFGYKGGAIVLVGSGFSNSLTQYDEFSPGSFFSPDELPPMSLAVDDFQAEFLTTGPQRGQPVDFGADVTYTEAPGEEERRFHLEVNRPLQLDGVSVFLVGHGYAPELTVRDGTGEVAYSGPVAFLPQDASFASFGVLKVPDAEPEQLGFDGMFFPTYSFTMERGPFSSFPDALNPALSMLGYHGDLGMDEGTPQSVYELDTDAMEKLTKADGTDFRLDLAQGKTVELPDGLGSVTFDGWQRWVKLQVSHTPGKGIALAGVVLALVGLMGSLFVRRRRVWVRVGSQDGRTYVEVAGLDRSTVAVGLEDELRAITALVVPGGAPDTGPASPEPREV